MKSDRCFVLLAATMLATAATTVLTACTDDDDVIIPVAQSFNYKTTMFGSSDSQRILLDSLTADITDVVSNDSWLKVTAAPADEDRAIDIVSTKPDNDNAQAIVIVTDANGNHAKVTVKHQPLSKGDSGSGGNSEWIKEWYNFKTVDLEGFENAQQTPWMSTAQGHIPEDIRLQYRPEEGWEMAFSYLNDKTLKDERYFALYNKWTGLMRIWTYVVNPSNWGSDLMFNAYFGGSRDNDMYPLYHVHEYGIPSCHSALGGTLSRNAKLVDAQNQTFQTWLTPHRLAESLSPGWYCFELDMSGYVPTSDAVKHDWLKKDEDAVRFKFLPVTTKNATITLNGALTGSVSGTFENEKVVQEGGANATSGIFSSLASGLSAIGGIAANQISTQSSYAFLMANGGSAGAGGVINPIKMWGGYACSIASGLFSFLGNQLQDQVTTKTTPGKIDLTIDASIALNGYLKEFTGNNQSTLSVSAEGIYTANGESGHVGKGVWGLEEDPVVYIDKDDIISTQNNFNVGCTEDGYTNSTFADYDVRIVYAFDPTSVKINLNEDLFKGIDSVTVTTNVGVIPNLRYGNTDEYRKMLMLGDKTKKYARPSFSLAEGKTSGTLELSGRSMPVVTKVGLDELADGDYETAENCTVVTQKTSDGKGWQRFHGRLIDASSKQIIVDPQVYIPYSTDDDGKCTGIGIPTAPDFVVRVEVGFSALDDNLSRKRFHFSKLFIPKVEVVDYDRMCKIYSDLSAYAQKCEQELPVGTLANDSNVPVRNPDGHILIGKTLRLLKRICE